MTESRPLTATDGRTARRDRGRTQVLDAAIELFTEGTLEPTPEQVAVLAGVSSRTVYRYFEDRAALLRASIDRHFERIEPLATIPHLGEGTLDERIDTLVRARVRLVDAVSAAHRAASVRAMSDPVIAERLDFVRAALREQTELQFSAELDPLGPDVRAVRATAIDLLTGIESIDALRRNRGQSVRATRAVLADSLGALLRPSTNPAVPPPTLKEH